MRYREIKLAEAINNADNSVESIEDNVDELSDIVAQNPEVEKEVTLGIKQLTADLLKSLKEIQLLANKITTQPEPAPTAPTALTPTPSIETESVDDISTDFDQNAAGLEDVSHDLEAFCNNPKYQSDPEFTTMCANVAKKLQDADIGLENLKNKTEQGLKSERKAGEDQGYNNAIAEVSKLSGKISQLAQNAQDFVSLDEEQLASLKAKERKEHLGKAVFIQGMTDFLNGFFLKHIFGNPKDPGYDPDEQYTPQEVIAFIDAAIAGKVLNMAGLVKSDQGIMDTYVNETFKPIWKTIIYRFMNWQPTRGGSGAIGPGEMAIAMLGNPAKKAKHAGDIVVGDEVYEIKAGNTSGGRMNSKAVQSGTTGWNAEGGWTKGIEAIVKRYEKIAKKRYSSGEWDLDDVAADPRKYSANEQPKDKVASKYNMNDTGLLRLNEEVLGPYSDHEQTFNLLYSTFSLIIQNLSKIKDHKRAIERMISNSPNNDYLDGQLKLKDDRFFKNYTYLLFESYKLADVWAKKGFEGKELNIIFINTNPKNAVPYTIVRGSQQLMDKYKQSGGFARKGGFNWNDDQQKASPQYVVHEPEAFT